MSASLLDVNVLVAIFDPGHVHHEPAHEWFVKGSRAWASCPMTVLGFLRILTNAGYPERFTTEDLVRRLRNLMAETGHESWSGDLDVLEQGLFDFRSIQGHRQLTDVYLLALAVKNGGELVTFDRTIPWRAVRGAKASHLRVLGGAGR